MFGFELQPVNAGISRDTSSKTDASRFIRSHSLLRGGRRPGGGAAAPPLLPRHQRRLHSFHQDYGSATTSPPLRVKVACQTACAMVLGTNRTLPSHRAA